MHGMLETNSDANRSSVLLFRIPTSRIQDLNSLCSVKTDCVSPEQSLMIEAKYMTSTSSSTISACTPFSTAHRSSATSSSRRARAARAVGTSPSTHLTLSPPLERGELRVERRLPSHWHVHLLPSARDRIPPSRKHPFARASGPSRQHGDQSATDGY